MTKISDNKFQGGDRVIWNSGFINPDGKFNEAYDIPAEVVSIYAQGGKSRGDYAYLIHYGKALDKRNYVWGYSLRPAMFKYDPKQAGDTEDDV